MATNDAPLKISDLNEVALGESIHDFQKKTGMNTEELRRRLSHGCDDALTRAVVRSYLKEDRDIRVIRGPDQTLYALEVRWLAGGPPPQAILDQLRFDPLDY